MRRLAVCLALAPAIFGYDSAFAGPPEALIAAAQKEGALTLIGYNRDWCGFGATIDDFKQKFGLVVNELAPSSNGGEQLEALRANKENTGPQAPDVIEVGAAFGEVARQEGLLLPYKASLWDELPTATKDPEGYWYGDTIGVMAFEINADIVKTLPQDWSDLLAPEYANMVALASDPRTSNMALLAIYAAGLSVSGDKTAKAAEAGIAFFTELNKRGNFVTANGNAANLAQGTTPIAIRWDFLARAEKAALDGNPHVEVVIPKSGIIAGMNVYAVSAHAPHPNAGKLWVEHLSSDDGQLNFIRHGCHPVRYDDLLKRGVIRQICLPSFRRMRFRTPSCRRSKSWRPRRRSSWRAGPASSAPSECCRRGGA